jgi:FtsP/CotA-like multicopper oxidase with cupredoxin domain
MYHCHFEDVEHVQMGMTGLLFVRPALNYLPGTLTQKFKTVSTLAGPKQQMVRYVFNDTTTEYDREFPLFLSENMPEDHWRDAHIQVSDWAYYHPGFSLFNGRAFPDTIEGGFNPMTTYASGSTGERLRYQPISSLFEVNAGEKVLLRVAHLGSIRHTITVDGIPLHVVGADASQLKGKDNHDNSFVTNSVDLGPGESRDVLFTAPSTPGTYLIYDRNFMNLSNNGGGGYGGMLTHLVVRAPGTLAPQTAV